MTGETQVEIQSGLSDGDEIITGPFKALREIKDGDRVRLEEPKKAEASRKEGLRRASRLRPQAPWKPSELP